MQTKPNKNHPGEKQFFVISRVVLHFDKMQQNCLGLMKVTIGREISNSNIGIVA